MQGNAWLPNYIKRRPMEVGSPKKDVTLAPVRSALENEEQQESPGGSWATGGTVGDAENGGAGQLPAGRPSIGIA